MVFPLKKTKPKKVNLFLVAEGLSFLGWNWRTLGDFSIGVSRLLDGFLGLNLLCIDFAFEVPWVFMRVFLPDFSSAFLGP